MTIARLTLCTTSFVILSTIGPTALLADGPELQSVSILGQGANHNFGRRAKSLGDVNGDGYDDIAIAAPYANNGAGIVYVFFGGPPSEDGFFNATPDLILHGQQSNDQFGWDIAGGDFNGDGYNDIAVAARLSNLGANNAGAVFIYFGGPTLSTTPDLILKGEFADDWFGSSLSACGDVNGDGYIDLIVGAPYNDDQGNASGKAYVYFGAPGSDMNDQPDVILYGAAANHSHFGWSVGGGGDVNGDGFADVIVGARLHGTGPNNAKGRVYVFHGAPGNAMNSVADRIIEGEFPHDWFGESVANAGDVNGDGYDDIVVGAHFADPNGSASGKGYVYFGGPSGVNPTPGFTYAGPHADAQLGYRVSGAGDVNDSGYDAVIFGAHFANAPGASAAGKAFVVFGGASVPSNHHDIELAGTQSNEQFGECVSGAGLVTGKPPAAFIVGAHFNTNANGTSAGMATVYRFSDRDDPPPCPGSPADLNCDGSVGVADLLILLASWGQCTNCDECPADLDGNCNVGVADLLILLSNWG